MNKRTYEKHPVWSKWERLKVLRGEKFKELHCINYCEKCKLGDHDNCTTIECHRWG